MHPSVSPTVSSAAPKSISAGRAARQLQAQSLSANTLRAYSRTLGRFRSWLDGREPTDTSLSDYLAHLHAAGKAPSTIAQVRSAVRYADRKADTTVAGPQSETTLAGIRREGRSRGRGQATGLTWSRTDAIQVLLRPRSLQALRDAALIAVMSDAMLHASEAVAVQVQGITTEADGTGRLAVHQSKTDQKGTGAVLYLGAPTLQRVQAWLTRAGIESGPVFRSVRKAGSVTGSALTTRSVSRIIKRIAEPLGITGRVSSHSFRVGSAQSLVERGATLTETQLAGRWKSARMPAPLCARPTRRTRRSGPAALRSVNPRQDAIPALCRRCALCMEPAVYAPPGPRLPGHNAAIRQCLRNPMTIRNSSAMR